MSRLRYDDAPAEIITVAEALPDFDQLERVVLVRDLRGRCRLVWRPRAGSAGPTLDAAEAALTNALGGWFAPPILSTAAPRRDLAAIARQIIDQAGEASLPAGLKDPRTGAALRPAACWRSLSRRLSKESWLERGQVSPPWPLRRGLPTVVAFHSFKGGVGRTTALALVAWHLAADGARILTVDLDLESPGLDRVLAVEPDDGVLDLLLTHAVTGTIDPGTAIDTVGDLHGRTIDVLRAGRVDRTFVEKLARLDSLVGNDGTSPMERGLRALLQQVKQRYDWILLDNRSGLADVAGLALTSVAHIDVLVARANRQGEIGLALTSDLLARRRPTTEQRIIVAQAMTPLPFDAPANAAARTAFRDACWNIFHDTFYAGQDDIPGPSDPTGAHHPLPIPDLDELRRSEAVASIEESTVRNERFAALADRIRELAAPEEP